MAVTIEEIATFLDKRGWFYELDPDANRIVTRVQAEHIDSLVVAIALHEEGRFFEIFAPNVIGNIQNHHYKEKILQTMLYISWETKMLQWEYDPFSGEIRAVIEFPLEDAPMTENQFNRCLEGLIHMVDAIAVPRLRTVMATGNDPGDEEAGERLLLALQERAPGLLDMLERAMEARKRRGLFFQ